MKRQNKMMKSFYSEIVLQIQRRIHIVHIFLIQFFPQELAGFTNTGNMKYSKRATNTYYWVTVSYRQSRKIVMKL